MLVSKEEVFNFLPHKPPFLFVDTVESVTIPENIDKENISSKDLVGAKVIAHYSVREDLEILAGHFPGNPILPGVIQVEMMAQSSAFMTLAINDMKLEGMKVETLLLGVDNAKFRKPIFPGMDLEIHATMDKCRGQMATYHCEIYSAGEKVSEAKFLAQIKVNL